MDRRDFLKRSGWSLLGLAAMSSGASAFAQSASGRDTLPDDLKADKLPSLKDFKLFIGDVHNHCNVTYGHGDLADALAAAEQQLDFASVTPHAMWPDIAMAGQSDARLAWVIGYHTEAFERLRKGGYEKYRAAVEAANRPGKFLTFISYECHSMEHGDHVALFHDFNVPLVECTSVPDLRRRLAGYKCFVTPHHMGYQTGFRGYNWDAFEESPQAPFVEMFSRHGLAESDSGDYNYLHDMGPRVWEGSVLCGLERGHKFGLMCSTDQHAGYPGSYGDGRIGVYAGSLDRDEIWDAMAARHVCGLTGDRIKVDFRINSGRPGDVIQAGRREIYINVEGMGHIDYVDIIKNGECLARLGAPHRTIVPDGAGTVRAKLKVNFGWNREEEYVHWLGKLRLTDGVIRDVQTCFRGAAFTSPQPGESEFRTRVNRLLERGDRHVALDMYSSKNPNVLTPAMQGVILDVEMPRAASVVADFNGHTYSHTLDELLQGTRAHFLRGWLSEAIQFERAATESGFCTGHVMTDETAERPTDYYYARVRQCDGQWAWTSPIWVEQA